MFILLFIHSFLLLIKFLSLTIDLYILYHYYILKDLTVLVLHFQQFRFDHFFLIV